MSRQRNRARKLKTRREVKDEETRRSPSSEPAGEEDTMKVGGPPVQVTTVIKTETKTETKTEVIRVPFEVSAHSPLLCWIQTEFNFLILFSVWITIFLGQASSFVHRRFRSWFPRRSVPLPPDDFDVPAPDNLVATGDSQHLHDSDVAGDSETPVAPGHCPV